MTGLLSWAVPGSRLLVGLADPLDAAAEPVLVPARLELDADRRPMVVFLAPGGRLPEHADAGRLGEDWAAVHVTASGEGWALRVFAPGSPGHLGWQLRQTRRRLRQLLATDRLDDPETTRQVTSLAAELHRLACRAALLAAPSAALLAAPSAGQGAEAAGVPAERLPAA